MGSSKKTVIGLDLSTKSGYSILVDGKRVASGTVKLNRSVSDNPEDYPFNYVYFAKDCVEQLSQAIYTQLNFNRIPLDDVTILVVEETAGSSKNNYSQKILEFIHFDFICNCEYLFPNAKLIYIKDGVWKNATLARMTDSEKKNNAKISRLKAKKLKENPELKRVIVKKDKDGNKLKKVTYKDAYIRRANEIFNLELGREQEDEAAALLIAHAYNLGVPACDGTLEGGVRKKDV